ncbi:MAG: PqqD family protein [Candidatus Poribacteria bacterium]|nr:PqqD family protein [Candidatus Poribacteria bacterium]
MLNKILYTLKLKKRPDVDRDKVLKAFPLRNQLITWEVDDKGEASLVIPQKDKFWVRITSKIFMLPDKRVVVLDSIGALVWQMCDGKHTITQIIKALQKKHQLTRKEAETSLFTFIKQLGKRNFIGFAIPTETKQNVATPQKPEPQKRFGFLSRG